MLFVLHQLKQIAPNTYFPTARATNEAWSAHKLIRGTTAWIPKDNVVMKNVTPAYDTQVWEESSICKGLHEFPLSSERHSITLSLFNWWTRKSLILTQKNICWEVGVGVEEEEQIDWGKKKKMAAWGEAVRHRIAKETKKLRRRRRKKKDEIKNKNMTSKQKPKLKWKRLERGREKREKKAVNSLKAYPAGIRLPSNLGETGLTNPSHSSSLGIWGTHSDPHTGSSYWT